MTNVTITADYAAKYDAARAIDNAMLELVRTAAKERRDADAGTYAALAPLFGERDSDTVIGALRSEFLGLSLVKRQLAGLATDVDLIEGEWEARLAVELSCKAGIPGDIV